MWYKKRKSIPEGAVTPKEVVFEIVDGPDDVGCGLAIADITESAKHYHKKTLETYTLVSGQLKVYIGDEIKLLSTPGDTITIPINTPHWAESLSAQPARISVFTVPAWTHEDHLIVQDKGKPA